MEKVGKIMRLGWEYIKPKKSLPREVYKTLVEANSRYPQTEIGIEISMIHALLHEPSIDLARIRSYGITRDDYKDIVKRMERIHKSIEVSQSRARKLRNKVLLRVISTYILNFGVINGIADYIRDGGSIEKLKALSSKLIQILHEPHIDLRAVERVQNLRNGSSTRDSRLPFIVAERMKKELSREQLAIFDKYFDSRKKIAGYSIYNLLSKP